MKQTSQISADEALELILSKVSRMGVDIIALRDALGRALSADIYAKSNLPPFDNSSMDGYAVRSEDIIGATRETPRKLRILAEAPAGTVVSEQVVPGSAVRIMTGAPIPPGADTVVMVEDTDSRDGVVFIHRESARGSYIRGAGEDVRQGFKILSGGSHIGPAEMGMLAALGRVEVEVYKKPRVAIITSGNELVDPSDTPRPGQIRDTNQYSLSAQVLQAGGEISVLARVTDEKDELERVLASAAANSDLLIASGGVSVGDYDFVKETLARLGDICFWRVRMRPGKPLLFGNIKGIPLFGLPGNPVSSMVTFNLFVRPFLRLMMGIETALYMKVSGIITQDIGHQPAVREFVRAITQWVDGKFIATPTGQQGSGRISSMLNANSYIIIPEGTGSLCIGDSVELILFTG